MDRYHVSTCPPPPQTTSEWNELPDEGLKWAQQQFSKWKATWKTHHGQSKAQSTSQKDQISGNKQIERTILSKKEQKQAVWWGGESDVDQKNRETKGSWRCVPAAGGCR